MYNEYYVSKTQNKALGTHQLVTLQTRFHGMARSHCACRERATIAKAQTLGSEANEAKKLSESSEAAKCRGFRQDWKFAGVRTERPMFWGVRG